MTATPATPAQRASRSRTLEQAAPAYVQIAVELRRRIERGDYPVGAPLPSQRTLSEEFGVTVMTLRHALEQLKREGLLVTRRGMGTYVAPVRFEYSVGPLRSFTREMAAQGRTVRTEVLGFEHVAADAGLAASLELPEGEAVVVVDRLRRIDGEPSVLQQSAVPRAVWLTLGAPDLERHSLYALLAEHADLDVDHASERLCPVVLDARVAALLGRSQGEPALLSERVSRTAAERPVLRDTAFIPGDRLVIATDRRRSDLLMRYELLSADGVPETKE